MNIRTATRTLAAAAALTLVGLSLTACGGGGMDGEYYGTYSDSSGQIYNVVTIDGNSLTIEYFGCDDELDEAKTSSGEISEDETTLVWTDGTSWDGQRDFTATESTVTFGNTTLHKKGTEAADQVIADQQRNCGS